MRLPTFSFSRFNTQQNCPLNMKLSQIDHLCPKCKKGPQPRDCPICPFCGKTEEEFRAPALLKGGRFATTVEKYLKTGEGMPPLLDNAAASGAIRALRTEVQANSGLVLVEAKWLYQDWTPVEDYPANITLKTDVVILDPSEKHIQIIDWKTGGVAGRNRLKPEAPFKYKLQLELYALGAMLRYAWCDEVSTALYFVDARDVGRTDMQSYFRADVPALLKLWEQRRQETMSEIEFKPKPGWYCDWCDWAARKCGPCIYGK